MTRRRITYIPVTRRLPVTHTEWGVRFVLAILCACVLIATVLAVVFQ